MMPDFGDAALCAQTDPILFFPEGRPNSRAIKLCQQCEFQDECYQFAIDTGQEYGIWGGVVFSPEVAA
jgi:WhiB family redox-sensing transcriptional regulator